MKIVLRRIVEQTIEISGGDTGKSLKKKLMDEKSIPRCLQTLQLNGQISIFILMTITIPGEDLEDGRTLADYGIAEGSAIEAHQASGCYGGGCLQIHAMMPNGDKIPLGAHTFDMVHQIKEKIAVKLKITASEQHIVFIGRLIHVFHKVRIFF